MAVCGMRDAGVDAGRWLALSDAMFGWVDANLMVGGRQGAWDLSAYPLTQNVPVALRDLLHEDDHRAVFDYLALREATSFRCRMIWGGRWRWFQWNVEPEAGSCTLFAARLLAEEDSRALVAAPLEIQSSALLESAPVMAWATDGIGEFCFANRAMRDFIGEGRLLSGWESIVATEDRARVRKAVAEALRSRRDLSLKIRVLGESCGERWCVVQAHCWVDENEGRRGLVGTCHEVHDLHCALVLHRSMEGDASGEDSLRDLGLLAGGIAHDFNNLLTVIRSGVEIAALDADDHGGPSSEGLFADTLEAIEQAADLSRKILAFSGKARLEREVLDIGELIRSVVRQFLDSADRDVTISIPDEVLPVDGDRARLTQVLQNLVTNALDATDPGGAIQVAAGRADGSIWVTVEDRGEGMLASTAARMFEPYFSSKGPGRGLGLAASRGVVQGHGGSIEVESELGVGTRMKVRLPCTSRAPVTPERVAPRPEPRPLRVLLVDDDPSVRRFASDKLRRLGHEVIEAEGGMQAMQRIEGHRFDLAVVDYSMPGLCGDRVIDMLRKVQPCLPAVLMSGYTAGVQPSLADDCVFLPKPFSVEAIEQAMGEARSRCAPRQMAASEVLADSPG